MKQVQLLISILGLILILILLAVKTVFNIQLISNNLPITLSDCLNNPKENEVLALFLSKKLSIQLYEFEKNCLQEYLSMFSSLINIHQGHNTIKNQPCRYNLIPKINQFHQSPAIRNRSLLLIFCWIEQYLI